MKIKKAPEYEGKILINLDGDKAERFNNGEIIEITAEENKAIGEHRWLIYVEEILEEKEDVSKDIK